MRKRLRSTLVTVGAAAVAAALGFTVAASGATNDAPKTEYRQASCNTDAAGICTVTHSLGAVPVAVIVSPNTPGQFNSYNLNTVRDSYTATSFKVRAMFTQTQPKANGTIWFTYVAYAAGVTPPPPPPTTTQPPPTTTQPPPTTTTPPPPGGCANPTKFLEQDGGDFGPYFIHNNAWNWQGNSSGQHELLYACDYNNWWVDTYGFAPSGGEVFMYPNVHLDVNNMNGLPLTTWPNAITGKFAGKGPGAGSYNVAWDLWLNGVADANSLELMVWDEKHGDANPAGTKRGTYTDASTGKVYDVWWDGTQRDQAYLAFVSQTTQQSGTVDLRGMITYASAQHILPAGVPTVNQIDYGIEVRDTAGATAANPYRFTLTDFGITLN